MQGCCLFFKVLPFLGSKTVIPAFSSFFDSIKNNSFFVCKLSNITDTVIYVKITSYDKYGVIINDGSADYDNVLILISYDDIPEGTCIHTISNKQHAR